MEDQNSQRRFSAVLSQSLLLYRETLVHRFSSDRIIHVAGNPSCLIWNAFKTIFSVGDSSFEVFFSVRRVFSLFFFLVKKQQLPARIRCLETLGFHACVEKNKLLNSLKFFRRSTKLSTIFQRKLPIPQFSYSSVSRSFDIRRISSRLAWLLFFFPTTLFFSAMRATSSSWRLMYLKSTVSSDIFF